MKHLKLLLSATASVALAAALSFSSSNAQILPTIRNASDLRRERGLPSPSNRIRNASDLRRERGLASPNSNRIRNASELRRERGLGVKR